MNARLFIFAVLATTTSHGQNVAEEPSADPVLDAIHEFNTRDKDKPAEIRVMLDPEVPPVSHPEEASKAAAAVLVTGKPPEGAGVGSLPQQESQDAIMVPPDANSTTSETGLSVRVESLHTGNGTIDPAQVKLLAPFPAKPLAQPPAGWRLAASGTAPPFTREVEIAPGSKIILTIRPHLLVPDSDGAQVFSVSEPGYDCALGYQQTATVGAILSNSIRRMDDESKQLGTAIDNLQQLLISLPKPASLPVIEPIKPAPVRKK